MISKKMVIHHLEQALELFGQARAEILEAKSHAAAEDFKTHNRITHILRNLDIETSRTQDWVENMAEFHAKRGGAPDG